MNFEILMLMIVIGSISFVALVAILFLFGKLIWLQTRIWLLARKGYTQVRHVKEDKVEKYYYIKVADGAYNFNGGMYIRQDDATTRATGVINRFDYNLLKQKQTDGVNLTATELEVLKFLESIRNSKLMDINSLSWGIPTITYYGNDPNPVVFGYKDRKYDAKNISSLIKRIIMTKEWKLVRIVLILCVIALFLWVVLGFLDYAQAGSTNAKLGQCLYMLNESNAKWVDLATETALIQAKASVQNSTIII